MSAIAKIPPEREAGIHVRVADMLDAIIGQRGITNSNGVLWFSVEQATPGAGARIERSKRGVVSGQPDVWLVSDARLHGIELKRPKLGRTSDDQRALHAELMKAGCRIAIARSCEDVLAALIAWGVPFRKISFQGKAA